MTDAMMQQELLAWRAFWQRTLGHLNHPALADEAKLLEILHDAQDMAMTQEGGLADRLFKEYLRLRPATACCCMKAPRPAVPR